MTEKQWQAIVVELLQRHGWRVFHPWTAIHSAAGYPDLTAVRDGRLLFIECKTAKGRVSKAQVEWLTALDGVKVADAFVCRPADDLGELEALIA